MGRWALRHRDAATLEERRQTGLQLLSSGLSQAEVARRLEISPVAVCRWKTKADSGGSEALRAVPRPGRPPRISREQQATLPSLLAKGALAYGFSTDLWTIPRIAKVVHAEWGTRYSETAIWRMLERHGLSWQKPRRRAREKDLRAVRNWTNRSWPRYKKKARRRRAVVVFVDESGFSSIPFVGKTWAPVGRTPVLVHQGRWPKFSAISGVTPRGKLYIQVRKSTIATPQVIQFLRHLLRHIRRRPILIFWDGGRPHKSDATRAFLRAHPRLETHRFPGYSPEPNPDEWVWRHLKIHEHASYAPHDVKELGAELRKAVMRMRVRPKPIRSFVAASHLYD